VTSIPRKQVDADALAVVFLTMAKRQVAGRGKSELRGATLSPDEVNSLDVDV
jgi:hypothetical protein